MERVYIQLNPVNMITITIMAAVGFALYGVVISTVKPYLPSTN